MKKFSFLFISLFGLLLSSNAQIKYLSDGKLTMGNVSPVGYYTTHLFGWGHYFSYVGNGYNTFMKVCLSVAAPRISGTGDQIVFYNSETSQFNSIQVKNVYNYSDARAKTNIVPIKNAKDKILSLNPVTYNWKEPGTMLRRNAVGDEVGEIGFLAQEVEEILPEAVHEDEEGNKLINYTAIIPILTESLKELTSQLDKLQSEVEDLRASKDFSVSDIHSDINKDSSRPKLYQNTPNPFNSQTQIRYYLPSGTNTASICIFNLQGGMILKKEINSGVGEGSITINAHELSNGIYLYSLVVNNKDIETKRMLLTN